MSTEQACARRLQAGSVLLGVDTHARLSYALSLEKIQVATRRLKVFLAQHAKVPARVPR